MQMVQTALRLPEKVISKIDEIAEKKRRNRSQMMRVIIEDYIEKYEL